MLRKVLLVLGPMSFAVAALVACEDDTSSGATGSIDAGNLDVVTTPPTTGDSATPVDGQAATAAIAVTVSGTRLNGVNVIFHDANGVVVDKAQTDASGKAASSATGIAMVTAIQARDAVRHAVTWTNVSPGDVLTLPELPATTSPGTYTVSVPFVAGNRAGFRAYSGSCASDFTTIGAAAPVDLTSDRCFGPSPSALLASAVLATSGATDFAFTKTGPAAPFGGSNVPATLGAWAAPSTTQVIVDNIAPSGSVAANVSEIANGLLFSPVPAATIASSTAVGFSYPAGFADAFQAQIGVTAGTGMTKVIAKRLAPGPAITFDYAQFLGTITGSTIDTTNPIRPVLAWGGDPTTSTDGGLVTVAFSLPNDQNTYTWTFVVPPGTSTVTAPALPTDLPLLPAADAGIVPTFTRPIVTFIEADAFDSAASFRQQQGAIMGPFAARQLLSPIPVLAANGTFRATSYFQLR